jgi:hypothetical protein
MLSKDKLIVITDDLPESDQVISHVVGAAGKIITSTDVNTSVALDVNVVKMAGQYTEDSAHVDGALGNLLLAVRKDTEGPLAGTDGDYSVLQTDEFGRLRVIADMDAISLRSEHAEDSAHVDGDFGSYQLSVRQDTLASSTTASGDYQSLKSDSLGALWIHALPQDAPNTSLVAAAAVVGISAAALLASPLASRKRLVIQNLGNKAIFIGGAGVTVASGLRIASNATYEMDLGAGVVLQAISTAAAQDVRVMEVS